MESATCLPVVSLSLAMGWGRSIWGGVRVLKFVKPVPDDEVGARRWYLSHAIRLAGASDENTGTRRPQSD
jgi:hypothetical protein